MSSPEKRNGPESVLSSVRSKQLDNGFEFRGKKYVLTDPLFSVAGYVNEALDYIELDTDIRTILLEAPKGEKPFSNTNFGDKVIYPEQTDDTISGRHVVKFRIPNYARPYKVAAKSSAVVGQQEVIANLMDEYATGCPSENRELLERRTLIVTETNELITIPNLFVPNLPEGVV